MLFGFGIVCEGQHRRFVEALLAGINQGDLALNSGNYDLSYQGNNLTITKALLNVIADARDGQQQIVCLR